MNEHSLPTEDEAAFEGYLDILAAALHHRSRKQPLRDYCTGLLLPEGRKSMEPMAARLAPARTRTMHKTLLNFVSEGAWSDEANCDLDKCDRDRSALVVRDRIKSPIRAIRIGGLPGSLDAVWPSGP